MAMTPGVEDSGSLLRPSCIVVTASYIQYVLLLLRVLICMLLYVVSADSVVVTVAILVTLVSLLGATFLVFLKRKTLLRLLFTNKKSPLEKLR